MAQRAPLEQAYAHVCEQRKRHSPHNSIWQLRGQWPQERTRIQRDLLYGQYRFEQLRRYHIGGSHIDVWSARDAVVLKALALELKPYWLAVLSPHCHHLQGPSGIPRVLSELSQVVGRYRFVCRSDVKWYYASLRHHHLLRLLKGHIKDRRLLRLIGAALRYTVCDGGEYMTYTQGVPLGSPLSPLLGALYLSELDALLDRCKRVFYALYMDDWIILAWDRQQFKGIIRRMNELLHAVEVEKHPDKTFIGKVERGVSFLGVRFDPQGVSVATESLVKGQRRVLELQEQGASFERVQQYLARREAWYERILSRCALA